ncbi:Complex I intermediate-associated protein 30, mitochondrial [Amphibalanus amphitrite]|uniref:Complex I intermediate-associated protein 30, mitochondrial n=1 Tax=Amphibalanus amphitrite TaxID=1232801 RepID=A0A6A4VJD2_AMPAM|nr:Complex I intermediate-associated protein 30, mitochondrial [Amphibalanus amphitrite]
MIDDSLSAEIKAHILASFKDTEVIKAFTEHILSEVLGPAIKKELAKRDEKIEVLQKQLDEKRCNPPLEEMSSAVLGTSLDLDFFIWCEVDMAFQLTSEAALRDWVVTSDRDNDEGNSWGELVLGRNGKAVLRGTLDTTVPRDGSKQRTGYCNMRCLRPQKSFKRDSFFDWSQYTHVVLRVRGDGRSYMLNLAAMGYFDIMWNDIFSYPLYTRGGPYWQVTRIPFSKFFLTSKGRIQDKQSPLTQDRITSVGITAGGVSGPFQLEIDYIGLEMDPRHGEDFAYEMYQTPAYIAGV